MSNQIKKLHRLIAFFLFIPFIWVALTGALLGFAAESDRIANVQLMTTPHSNQASQPETLLKALIESHYPGLTWQAWRPASTKVDTNVAIITTAEGEWIEVYVQTHIPVINGERPITSDWRVILYQWHRFAFLGDWGFYLTWLSAGGWVLLALTGWLIGHKQKTNLTTHARWGKLMILPISLIAVTGLGTGFSNESYAHLGNWLLHLEQSAHDITQWSSWHTGQALGIPGRILWVVFSASLLFFALRALLVKETHLN